MKQKKKAEIDAINGVLDRKYTSETELLQAALKRADKLQIAQALGSDQITSEEYKAYASLALDAPRPRRQGAHP